MRAEFLKMSLVVTTIVGAGDGIAMPTMCSVVNTPAFRSCLDLQVRQMVCGPIPHPCAQLSYYVPETYIEVVAAGGESFFHGLPGVASQLATVKDRLPACRSSALSMSKSTMLWA